MKNYLKTFSDKDITFMLYGLFLGDGSYRNGLLRIRHTNKQRFYILWLKNICELLKLNYKVKFDFEMKTNFGDFVYSYSVNFKKELIHSLLIALLPSMYLSWFEDVLTLPLGFPYLS